MDGWATALRAEWSKASSKQIWLWRGANGQDQLIRAAPSFSFDGVGYLLVDVAPAGVLRRH